MAPPQLDWEQWHSWSSRFTVHPGHLFLLSSIPFNYWAYKGYQKPLEEIVQGVLKQRTGGRVKIRDIKGAEEDVRRAVAGAVASRALRVATCGSIGVFSLFTASCFYMANCRSMSEAICLAKEWSHSRRKELDSWLGVENRVDSSHPEVLAVQSLSENEEMEYISKKYLPDEDWQSTSVER